MAQRIIDRSYVGEVLQHIYTSELNIKVTLFSEKGYFYIANEDHKLPLHGTTIEEAVTDLAFRIAKEFPSSGFAHWWSLNFQAQDFNKKRNN
ncbi:hypothetical protein [Chryseosolibacter indicus]|uniref:Uncharacterized protein n=1 Tax=Chryseosolibacter indicus TaxID=2782351 RepID=A0ABS5VU70_9BACT|nr:hypothetical protein [Chryseosolibacter indicus]MBT1704741.1 hypothetical protein [Chryseosolibacter indicus]